MKTYLKYWPEVVGTVASIPVLLQNFQLAQYILGMNNYDAGEAYGFGLGYLIIGTAFGLPILICWSIRAYITNGVYRIWPLFIAINSLIPVSLWIYGIVMN